MSSKAWWSITVCLAVPFFCYIFCGCISRQMVVSECRSDLVSQRLHFFRKEIIGYEDISLILAFESLSADISFEGTSTDLKISIERSQSQRIVEENVFRVGKNILIERELINRGIAAESAIKRFLSDGKDDYFVYYGPHSRMVSRSDICRNLLRRIILIKTNSPRLQKWNPIGEMEESVYVERVL